MSSNTYRLGALCVLTAIMIGVPVSTAHSQAGKQALLISGDIKTPYDVMGGVAFVMEVAADTAHPPASVQVAFDATVKGAFNTLNNEANKRGADAVVNIQLQFVVVPRNGATVNELLVFGTLVRYRS